VEVFKGAPDLVLMPGGFYHDCWWIRDEGGIYGGEGIHGQLVYVHAPSETVVVKFSTWPGPWMDDMASLTEAGVAAMCHALAG
jgi:CubicO group peptidase (beta-lactamase class C family)